MSFALLKHHRWIFWHRPSLLCLLRSSGCMPTWTVCINSSSMHSLLLDSQTNFCFFPNIWQQSFPKVVLRTSVLQDVLQRASISRSYRAIKGSEKPFSKEAIIKDLFHSTFLKCTWIHGTFIFHLTSIHIWKNYCPLKRIFRKCSKSIQGKQFSENYQARSGEEKEEARPHWILGNEHTGWDRFRIFFSFSRDCSCLLSNRLECQRKLP